MKYILFILYFALHFQGLSQQTNWEGKEPFFEWNNHRTGILLRPNSLPNDSSELLAWVASSYSDWFQNGHQLIPTSFIREKNGIHIQFQHTYLQKPVFGSGLKINKLNNTNSIFQYLLTPVASIKSFPLFNFWLLREDLMPVVCKREDHFNRYYDMDGKLVFEEDLNRYLISVDTTIKAFVFLPDPVTTAHTTYQGNYSDHNDSTNEDLNLQRTKVSLILTFENDSIRLKSKYLEIVSLNGFNYYSDSFLLSRNNANFEAINALYHVQKVQNNLFNLGFNDLANYSLQCDPHATTSDNSNFSFNGNTPFLRFGSGGVDDAEDADVIVHEYHHAISESASPGTFSGWQRKAIEEGFCDFFAGASSYGISPYNYTDVFNWDGHNQFWNGRSMNSSKVWPKDTLAAIYHLAGEIWSSCLNDIMMDIGRYATERMMYAALYHLSPYMSMPQVGQLVLDADMNEFSGNYQSNLIVHLFNRGLYQFPAAVSNGSTSSIQISGSFEFASGSGPFVLGHLPSNCGYELMNLEGQKVDEGTASSTLQISSTHLSSGPYFLRVYDAQSKPIYTTKLIKF